MQQLIYKHTINSLIIIFTILNILPFSAYGTDNKGKEKFEGYQIRFEYEKYPEEREIAYQYYLDHRAKYLSGIEKKDIGIDLYDIDNDGEKEIFVYVNGKDKCPRAGCPFATLKQISDKKYIQIPWSISTGTSLSIYAASSPKILSNLTKGYHDILFGERKGKISV